MVTFLIALLHYARIRQKGHNQPLSGRKEQHDEGRRIGAK